MIKVQGEINIPTKTSPLCFDIEINKGDACLVIGTNGSGKTTFLDIIGGNRKLDKGRLILNSEKPIGYALQDVDNCLLPWFSVIENILLPNKLFPTDNQNDEKLKNILQQFNLLNRKDDFPYKLSGGEKQIVNFIRTILSPSEILLFDEIFAAMHSDTKKIAQDILKDEIKGKTTLFVTHDADDLALPHNRNFAFINNALVEIDIEHAKRMLNKI
jgi:ABC-type nitrate/sulfonate/bicarbonate transport system ATPase subunit